MKRSTTQALRMGYRSWAEVGRERVVSSKARSSRGLMENVGRYHGLIPWTTNWVVFVETRVSRKTTQFVVQEIKPWYLPTFFHQASGRSCLRRNNALPAHLRSRSIISPSADMCSWSFHGLWTCDAMILFTIWNVQCPAVLAIFESFGHFWHFAMLFAMNLGGQTWPQTDR